MRRIDLQAFAEAKLQDAALLLENRRWSNSYYLAGYAVELGLKACIARQITAEAIPDKSILRDVMTHQFDRLLGLAGLRSELKEEQNSNAAFGANWAITLEWEPDARYRSIDATSAQVLMQAISHPTDGVLQWIKLYW